MNPLQFLYDEVDVLKDGKNGKISLVCDKVAKNFYVFKSRRNLPNFLKGKAQIF